MTHGETAHLQREVKRLQTRMSIVAESGVALMSQVERLEDQLAERERGLALERERIELLHSRLAAVEKLHHKITRYGTDDTSVDAEEYEEAPEDYTGFEPFDLCEECYEVELGIYEEYGGEWIGARSMWPCPTIKTARGE